ncbi:RNA 2',3'-cyclic phosphodiesterase [Dyella acidiphila]|uniref:RNA 2',3'-cyclic phosphodiesterase n=1 Tax=Dyella acidiphila TaxID=2775866 RepID=A0ABR9G6Z2_9GAMM|nr:RNA 2',3'-cyclic phosphodiesterase [Dyella acidiphila]MBE1159805.1 RNA 2',3'-cyclic phosphodiesterase [Dyella acidiphila]
MQYASTMTERVKQTGLFNTPPPETHRLFFALMPDEPVRYRIQQAARSLAEQHPELRARWTRPERFHATLNFLGDYPQLPMELVTLAKLAADNVHAPSFAWTLDYVASFRGREPPCVLRGSMVPPLLLSLWQEVEQALAQIGVHRRAERPFTPHVTLAYARRELPQSVPVEPISWQVQHLLLIHSVVGKGHYQLLGRWPLAS